MTKAPFLGLGRWAAMRRRVPRLGRLVRWKHGRLAVRRANPPDAELAGFTIRFFV